MSWIKYIPHTLFCAFFIKLGVQGADYPSICALSIMAALIIGMEIQLKLASFAASAKQNAETLEELEKVKKEMSEVRAYVSSQKMGQLRINKNS